MTTDHVAGHTVTVVVVCGFIGCDWSMAIGAAPLEAHQAYLDHLDVHDPDHIAAEPDCEECPSCRAAAGHPCTEYCRIAKHDAEVARALAEDKIPGAGALYAGDSPELVAAEQARVDRFMAGGEDR